MLLALLAGLAVAAADTLETFADGLVASTCGAALAVARGGAGHPRGAAPLLAALAVAAVGVEQAGDAADPRVATEPCRTIVVGRAAGARPRLGCALVRCARRKDDHTHRCDPRAKAESTHVTFCLSTPTRITLSGWAKSHELYQKAPAPVSGFLACSRARLQVAIGE